jgi:hypothetical protein
MAGTQNEVNVVRSLAGRLAEVAALPVQREKAELWRRLNRLEKVRPLVILQNATWHETGFEIELETEDEFLHGQEWWLRATLYHWDHMRDDSVYEAKAYAWVPVHTTPIAITPDSTPADHVFGARRYNTVIEDGADPSAVVPADPVVTVDWAEADRGADRLSELYDGILTVEKRGVGGHWFSIMDEFVTWRGIGKAFVDMVDEPAWVHAWLEALTRYRLRQLEECERLGVLSLNNGANGVGPGGLGFTDELPSPGFDGTHVRAKDQWGHATTQIFSEVSPAMHEEFALQYERRFLERFGLTGYGCCEPLDKKVDLILRNIPGLRRLSMSPWVDPARGAEALGDRCVFSFKPNPAIIGMEEWNGDLARGILRDAFEATRECRVEVLMKDLHTCRGETWRMWEWVRMAMELAEQYA